MATKQGQFSWKIIGGIENSARPAFLVGQPLDSEAEALFENKGGRASIMLNLQAGCTDAEALKLQEMLNEMVRTVALVWPD